MLWILLFQHFSLSLGGDMLQRMQSLRVSTGDWYSKFSMIYGPGIHTKDIAMQSVLQTDRQTWVWTDSQTNGTNIAAFNFKVNLHLKMSSTIDKVMQIRSLMFTYCHRTRGLFRKFSKDNLGGYYQTQKNQTTKLLIFTPNRVNDGR